MDSKNKKLKIQVNNGYGSNLHPKNSTVTSSGHATIISQ
jgi:hypothetical protein